VDTDRPKYFDSATEDQDFLKQWCPEILKYASRNSIEVFSKSPCCFTGKSKACSVLHCGRVGDAGAAFPPFGQGVNAATESAIILDEIIGQNNTFQKDIPGALVEFSRRWKPQTDSARAMSLIWISSQ